MTTQASLHQSGTARRGRALALALTLLVLAGLLMTGCGGAAEGQSAAEEEHAHEGDGGHGGGTAVTRWTDSLEVFFEHPPMIAGQASAPWAIHLTELSGYEPIRAGTLTLRFQAPGGEVYATNSDAPARAGIFTPTVTLPEPGTYRLLMDLESEQASGRIMIGELAVHENEEAVPHAHAEGEGSAISYLKEQQWEAGFAVARAQTRSIPASVEMSGEIVPAAERMARVAAPVSGLVSAPSNLTAPAPGDRVSAGQTMAVLAPVGGENSFTDAKARAERLQREVDRLGRLYDVRAIPEVRLTEARHDLEVAEAALESMGGSGGEGYSYPVRAPISGVVDERHLAIGARVEAGEPLYTIVNPDVVWVKMRVPAEYASMASGATGATFRPEGSGFTRQADAVVSVGNVIDRQTRTLPVTLAARNPGGRLKIGMFVDGQLQAGREQTGVAIPTAAIQREDGQAVAYVEVGGETFERRVLALGPSSAEYTLVEDGVQEDEFVVTQGAYQVYLASLSTDAVGGHGHAH